MINFIHHISLQEHYGKVYRYCYFRVHNAATAEDITQETFLRFFANRNYISRGKPLAYLYTVARNLCADSFRRPAEMPLTNESASDGISTGGYYSAGKAALAAPDKNIEALEVSASLKQALDTLPSETREVLLLRYANDLSMAEISAITGMSRFALRRMIKVALGKLRQIIKREDFI